MARASRNCHGANIGAPTMSQTKQENDSLCQAHCSPVYDNGDALKCSTGDLICDAALYSEIDRVGCKYN